MCRSDGGSPDDWFDTLAAQPGAGRGPWCGRALPRGIGVRRSRHLHARLSRARRPVLPGCGQRRLRRLPLLPDARLRTRTNQLTGTAVITATATQNLSQFDLDLRGFTVSRLLVERPPAAQAREGDQELVITPQPAFGSGAPSRSPSTTPARPQVVTDPDGSIEGWVPTDDGAFVVGEPQGSPGWYPVNDNPRDKATFDFSVTVPEGLTVMANGVLVSNATDAAARRPGSGARRDPMAPYLATATLGRFDLTVSRRRRHPAPTSRSTRPSRRAGPREASGDRASSTSRSTGRTRSTRSARSWTTPQDVGYSLETQTKPVFDRMPDETTLAHELSHMWFGDSVTLTPWPDIWLHEGFATWSEWIWSEHNGRKTAQQYFDNLYNTPASEHLVLDAAARQPGRRRRPLQRHDLRPWRDDAAGAAAEGRRRQFFRIMRTWATQNRYGNVTTPSSSRWPSRSAGWTSTTSSTCGSTSRTSRPPGSPHPRTSEPPPEPRGRGQRREHQHHLDREHHRERERHRRAARRRGSGPLSPATSGVQVTVAGPRANHHAAASPPGSTSDPRSLSRRVHRCDVHTSRTPPTQPTHDTSDPSREQHQCPDLQHDPVLRSTVPRLRHGPSRSFAGVVDGSRAVQRVWSVHNPALQRRRRAPLSRTAAARPAPGRTNRPAAVQERQRTVGVEAPRAAARDGAGRAGERGDDLGPVGAFLRRGHRQRRRAPAPLRGRTRTSPLATCRPSATAPNAVRVAGP